MLHPSSTAMLRMAMFAVLAVHGAPARGHSSVADSPDAGAEGLGEVEDDGASADSRVAQPDGSAPSPVTPPEIVTFVQATIPEEFHDRQVLHAVVLRLLVNEQGKVSEALVHEAGEPLAPALDEAARQAALKFRFDPARQADEPAAAWILYEYVLRWAPTATQAPNDVSTAKASSELDVSPEANEGRGRPDQSGEAPKSVEVVVRGRESGRHLRESALAIDVVDTREAQRLSGDLGAVLARQHGVAVRRVGGLGSSTTLSLNGLQGEQIRIFVDGVPAELAGYPLGIANLPVGFVERAEVYRGVLPIAYGSDALGGAINVVTAYGERETNYSASYQTGSFNTHRLSAGAEYARPSGLFTRVTGFFDTTDNDYVVAAKTVDARGRLSPAEVRRFHDGYRAAGASVDLGVQHASWARELSLRTFYTMSDDEVQHNALMTVPYGEVTYGKRSAGTHLKFKRSWHSFHLDSTSGYAWLQTNFVDVSECRYDWYGKCVAIPLSGEIEPVPVDTTTVRHALFSRNILSFLPTAAHQLRLALAPTFTVQSGRNERIGIGDYDPATAQRTQFSLISGLEYELRAWDDQFQNIAFVKDYALTSDTEEELPNGNLRDLYRTTHRVGAGNSLRQWLAPWTYAKASYEWATRLPNPEEMFGNGALVIANLHISPEASHNVNTGWYVNANTGEVGQFSSEINGFARWASNQIILLSNGSYFQYENVLSSRSVGLEGGARWATSDQVFGVGGNLTWQDVRNTSSSGPFAQFEGEYIPNRPYLFANVDARLRLSRVMNERDSLSLLWSAQYTHGFYRGWATLGDATFKARIPDQLTQTAALIYQVPGSRADISASLEVSNLTDQQAYDYWGAQRPGRAVAFKMVLTAPGEKDNP